MHDIGGFFRDQEGANQIDLDGLGEKVSRHRTVPAQRPGRTDYARAVDGQCDAAHEFGCPGDRLLHLRFRGNVCRNKQRPLAEICGAGSTCFRVHVQQRYLAARLNDLAGRCQAES